MAQKRPFDFPAVLADLDVSVYAGEAAFIIPSAPFAIEEPRSVQG